MRTSDTIQPAILISTDRGTNWQIKSEITNLPTHGDMVFDSLKCLGTTCLIVGNYESNGVHSLILSSTNSGQHWVAQSIDMNLNAPVLNSKMNCNNSFCITAGNAFLTLNSTQPVIFVADTKNYQWNTINNYRNTPTGLVVPQVTAASCSASQCSISLWDLYGSHLPPLILTTNDEGKTWSYIKDIQNFPVANSSALFDLNCTNHLCVAVGNISINQQTSALILQSKDDGATWTYIPTPIKANSTLYTVSCNESLCLAAGQLGLNTPYVLLSMDGGTTWKETSTLPVNANLISPLSVKVEKNNITLLGYNQINNPKQAAILTSVDTGKTWQVSTIDGLPVTATQSILNFLN